MIFINNQIISISFTFIFGVTIVTHNNTALEEHSQLKSFSFNVPSSLNGNKKLTLLTNNERVFYPGPLPTHITVIDNELVGAHVVPQNSLSNIEELLVQHTVLYFTGFTKRVFEKLVNELKSKYKIIRFHSNVEETILDLQLSLEKESIEREIIIIDARKVIWKEAEDLIDTLNTVFVNKNIFIYK